MDADIFILLSETRGVLRIDGNLSLLREFIASLGGSVIDEKRLHKNGWSKSKNVRRKKKCAWIPHNRLDYPATEQKDDSSEGKE